jgi:hypothetical protein
VISFRDVRGINRDGNGNGNGEMGFEYDEWTSDEMMRGG